MPRSRPMKGRSQGEVGECRKLVAFVLDHGWIVPSCASHAGRVCAEAGRDVELLPGLPRAQRHHAAVGGAAAARLVDETQGPRFFTKLDFATAYRQFRIREEDQYKTSFRVPGGQDEFRVGAFGLQGMSSVLMRFMHSIFCRDALSFDSTGRA